MFGKYLLKTGGNVPPRFVCLLFVFLVTNLPDVKSNLRDNHRKGKKMKTKTPWKRGCLLCKVITCFGHTCISKNRNKTYKTLENSLFP